MRSGASDRKRESGQGADSVLLVTDGNACNILYGGSKRVRMSQEGVRRAVSRNVSNVPEDQREDELPSQLIATSFWGLIKKKLETRSPSNADVTMFNGGRKEVKNQLNLRVKMSAESLVFATPGTPDEFLRNFFERKEFPEWTREILGDVGMRRPCNQTTSLPGCRCGKPGFNQWR